MQPSLFGKLLPQCDEENIYLSPSKSDYYSVRIPRSKVKALIDLSTNTKQVVLACSMTDTLPVSINSNVGITKSELNLTVEFLLTNQQATFALSPQDAGNLIDQARAFAKKYKDMISLISTAVAVVNLGISYLEYRQRAEIINLLKTLISRIDELERNILNAINEQTLILIKGELNAGLLELREVTVLIEQNRLENVGQKLNSARERFNLADGTADALISTSSDYLTRNKAVILWFEIIKNRAQVLAMSGEFSLISIYVNDSVKKIIERFYPQAESIFKAQYQIFSDDITGDPPGLYRVIYRGDFGNPVLIQSTFSRCQSYINNEWIAYREENWGQVLEELKKLIRNG